MAPGEGVSVVSVDEAWFDLRHHLDWTRGEGTLVFIVTESRAQAESLRERSALWAQRTGAPWMRAPADDSAAIWLRRHLPQRGILWVEIWDDAARLAALHVLNEARIRLAQPGGGCFVLCGPVRLLEEAAHEAADLWSIRSFARAVGDVVPTRADTAPELTGAPPSSDAGRVDGELYGAPLMASVKSFVWYSPVAFERAGYEVPTTWDELVDLTDRVVADHPDGSVAPWCLGASDGATTGWPVSDWLEDGLLAIHGTGAYDQWANHDVLVDAPAAVSTLDSLDSLLLAKAL